MQQRKVCRILSHGPDGVEATDVSFIEELIKVEHLNSRVKPQNIFLHTICLDKRDKYDYVIVGGLEEPV